MDFRRDVLLNVASIKMMNHDALKDRYLRHEQKRDIETHDAELAAENAQADAAAAEIYTENKETALQVTDKIESGKQLTKKEQDKLVKSPGVRMLVRTEFASRELNPIKMYVDVLEKAHKEVFGEDSSLNADQRLKRMRLIANETAAFTGLHATASNKDEKPTTLVIQFDGAFSDNDNASIEIGIRATPRSAADNRSSPLREVPDGDLRDKKWENPPGHGDTEVLGNNEGH